MSTLEIESLRVSIEGRKILKGVDSTINTGEIHVIMGPNGTGESALPTVIIGDPNYEVIEEEVPFDDINVLDLEVDECACSDLLLVMQYPSETSGVTNAELMYAAIDAKRDEDSKISVMQFLKKLDGKMELLNIPEGMAERYLNEGSSGGEKKRNEILQLLILGLTFAILDKIDSGSDIDALKVVSKGVNEVCGKNFGALIITHHQRSLNYTAPDVVHIMMEGCAVKTGGVDSTKRLEIEDYAGISQKLGIDYKEKA